MADKKTNVKDVNSVDVTIGAKINQMRIAQGMTRQELARRIGVTHQQLQKYERGVNRITASRLVDIARELGVEVTSFFKDMNTLPLDTDHIERQRLCVEIMRDFIKIERQDQQEAVRRLIRVLASED